MSTHGPEVINGPLVAACEPVAADGTDPRLLALLVGWAARPRRSPDALRRACRDASVRAPTSAQLSSIAGPAVSDADRDAARRLIDVWARLGVRAAVVGDPAYPSALAAGWPDTDGPTFVAWRGEPWRDRPAVAIVGARRATGYGTGVAAWLAAAAARAGARVVSGGAVGIDAAAHEAACAEAGGTTVVLGCGHAVAYPRVHARPGGLFDRIVAGGGTLLGELLPHEPPRAGQVRARNRIVAGLADVVVVVEGGPRSGALLTAGAAAGLGRTVLAVPGDVRAPGSAAPHRLLAEGVPPCTGPDDLLAALPGRPERSDARAGGSAPVASLLPDDIRTVLVDAWPRPVRIDALASAAGCSVPSLLAALTRARIAGEVADGLDGVRLRRPPDG